MNNRWSVYNLQGKLAGGKHVETTKHRDRHAVSWFIRWRVNGEEHKRTFKKKGHAETFRTKLLNAQGNDWPADERGWPIDPTGAKPSTPVVAAPTVSFETYANNVWYPNARGDWSDKNRMGHRHNMRMAIEFLRYDANDARLFQHPGLTAGDSILLEHLVPDDVLNALTRRRSINLRTAGVNQRRIEAATGHQVDVQLEPETASPATVRQFYITVAMILGAAKASALIPRDPLIAISRRAPKPKPARVSQRVVPSIDEVFDLSDAIAQIGPLGPDNRPLGERFRSLVLAGGTLGPRPGELTAHRPEWIDWHGADVIVNFQKTEIAIYDREEGVRGRQVHDLKDRDEDEVRSVPAMSAVADAIRLHLDRGYGTDLRTWTSLKGCPLDWGNLVEVYWRPACEKVFAGTAKSHLVTMPPKTLRKAAITFWLDAGISPVLASDWAGHSEDVAQRYYAGRAAASYQREIEKLARSRDAGWR